MLAAMLWRVSRPVVASMDAEIRHTRYIMSRLLLDCLRLIDEVRVRSGRLKVPNHSAIG